MKLSFLIGAAAGYVLGAKAGRERYETIVRVARRVGGSQTVQSTRGVLLAQTSSMRHSLQHAVGQALTNSAQRKGAGGGGYAPQRAAR